MRYCTVLACHELACPNSANCLTHRDVSSYWKTRQWKYCTLSPQAQKSLIVHEVQYQKDQLIRVHAKRFFRLKDETDVKQELANGYSYIITYVCSVLPFYKLDLCCYGCCSGYPWYECDESRTTQYLWLWKRVGASDVYGD